MPGFKNVGELVEAYDQGRHHTLVWRKNPIIGGAVASGRWVDFTLPGGMIPPNYYASSPLVSAHIDPDLRPYLPPTPGASKFLHKFSMIGQNSNGSTAGYGDFQPNFLCDYLMYYPFIDLSANGELQEMDNTVSLSRYQSGAGVQMLLVAQSPINGGGTISITYINQDGAQKTTPAYLSISGSLLGTIVSQTATSGTASVGPFIPLAAGDSGVRSVVSVTMTGNSDTGIAAIVLVKPLKFLQQSEASYRASTGGFARGEWVQYEYPLMGPMVEIQDGAHLGFFQYGRGDFRDTSQLVMLDIVWN